MKRASPADQREGRRVGGRDVVEVAGAERGGQVDHAPRGGVDAVEQQGQVQVRQLPRPVQVHVHDRARPGDLGRDPGRARARENPVRQRRRGVVQPRDRGGVEVPQRHGSGHGGGQMAVEGPRVRDVAGSQRSDGELEQVGPPADGADREAAADDLAEQRQVRRQPEPALLAAEPVAKPLHLVQDKEHAAVPGQAGDRGQEPGRGRPDPAGAEERLGEHRGDVVAGPAEQRGHGVQVVPRHPDHVPGSRAGTEPRCRGTRRRT